MTRGFDRSNPLVLIELVDDLYVGNNSSFGLFGQVENREERKENEENREANLVRLEIWEEIKLVGAQKFSTWARKKNLKIGERIDEKEKKNGALGIEVKRLSYPLLFDIYIFYCVTEA